MLSIHVIIFYRNPEPIKKGKFKVTVMYGEMSTVPLEQLTTMVDNVSHIVTSNNIYSKKCVCIPVQVMLPLIGNECNHIQWPHVVSQDVLKHTGEPLGSFMCQRRI